MATTGPHPRDEIRPGHRSSTFMPVGVFLGRIAGLHRKLAAYYDMLLEPGNDERSSQFAEQVLSQHEQVQHLLERYQHEHAHEHALTTWLQYLPDEQVQALIDERPESGASPREVIDHAIALERAFHRMYEQLAAKGEIEAVSELFRSLAQLEFELARRAAWARQELGD